jgi:hypothetical protein
MLLLRHARQARVRASVAVAATACAWGDIVPCAVASSSAVALHALACNVQQQQQQQQQQQRHACDMPRSGLRAAEHRLLRQLSCSPHSCVSLHSSNSSTLFAQQQQQRLWAAQPELHPRDQLTAAAEAAAAAAHADSCAAANDGTVTGADSTDAVGGGGGSSAASSSSSTQQPAASRQLLPIHAAHLGGEIDFQGFCQDYRFADRQVISVRDHVLLEVRRSVALVSMMCCGQHAYDQINKQQQRQQHQHKQQQEASPGHVAPLPAPVAHFVT